MRSEIKPVGLGDWRDTMANMEVLERSAPLRLKHNDWLVKQAYTITSQVVRTV